MSLDVYLKNGEEHTTVSSGIFVRRGGKTVEISREEWDNLFPRVEPYVFNPGGSRNSYIYTDNITHNLNTMADEAGLYEALWRPYKLLAGYNIPENDYEAEIEFEDKNPVYAKDIINHLRIGLKNLVNNPEKYQKLNPENGWGSYEGLIEFTHNYLNACINNPDAQVTVSR